MEKVVIFDWGGVVESHENNFQELNKAKIKLIKKFNAILSDEEILKRWPTKNSNGQFIDTINNKNDIQEWIKTIQKYMNIDVSTEEFIKAYKEEFSSIKYYKEVVEYAHSLKRRCKIAILSNLIFLDRERINNQYDLNKFDNVYLSFEMGMRKPEGRIYEYVLNDLQINPENILLIDDDIDNILMAEKYGWKTCQAYGYEIDKIKEEVEKFLIK